MDSTKKVVEPPKSATPPVKVQPQPQHDATKASAEQPEMHQDGRQVGPF